MAIKGLAIPVFGEYNYNGANVTYTNGFVAGAAIEYGVKVEASDNNPLYGDDRIIENDYGKFNSGTLTLGTSDLDQYTSKRLLGLKEVQVQVGDIQVTELVSDDDMKQSPKGFGIIETHQINNVDMYRAVVLCKVTMNIPAEAATTQGESIDWQTKEVEGTIARSDEDTKNYKHPWKREAWFGTQEAALEYLKTVLNALDEVNATSTAGESAGQTVITITNPVDGATYKYSTDGPVNTYKQDLTSWTALESGEPITVENGATVYIAQADSSGKAVGAGFVIAVVNEE